MAVVVTMAVKMAMGAAMRMALVAMVVCVFVHPPYCTYLEGGGAGRMQSC
jgi:hypothetical protein